MRNPRADRRATLPRRAAHYVRVSSGEQTVTNREIDVRRWAEGRGLKILKACTDMASGTRCHRDALAAVHRREVDIRPASAS